MYRKRAAEKLVKRILKSFCVLGLTGPRQSGKSTLLRSLLKDYEYVSFDVERNIVAFKSDPEGFIKKYSNKVIFDEVQYVPDLFPAIKYAVDEDRQNYGKYVITSSNQFSHLENISESLAGRIGLMKLLPFQYSEMPKALVDESIYCGAYPELVLRDYYERELWYDSYIDTYLSKDVRSVVRIGNMRDFYRFIELMAAQVTKTLDLTYYAKDIGVSVPTIKRWVSVLEASSIIFLVPPFYENRGKRLIKSPKVYFVDNGLVTHLTRVSNFDLYDKGPLAGPLFENYIVSEVYKKETHSASFAKLYFYRTHDRAEIDLIIDRKDGRELVKIKKSASLKHQMLSHMVNFREENDMAYLVYQGQRDSYKDVEVLPYTEFLKGNESS